MNNIKVTYALTANALCTSCQNAILKDLRSKFPFMDIHMQGFIMAARVICDACGNEDKNHYEYPAWKAYVKASMGDH